MSNLKIIADNLKMNVVHDMRQKKAQRSIDSKKKENSLKTRETHCNVSSMSQFIGTNNAASLLN